MQAANISVSFYNYEQTYQKVRSHNQRSDVQENTSFESRGYEVSITGEQRADERNALYTREGKNVNKNSEADEVKNITEDSPKSLGETKAEIKKQIEAQTYQLLKQYLGDSPEVKESLKEFFTNNPEALQQIEKGEIPEYFNVENTAKRILDIYFSRYNGEDKEEFAEYARNIISQAYGEVEGMVGTLPGIVQETRDKIYEVLDKFANGEDVSDFITLPEISSADKTE